MANENRPGSEQNISKVEDSLIKEMKNEMNKWNQMLRAKEYQVEITAKEHHNDLFV